MASRGIRPELVLCSSARRTRETLELLQPALEGVPARIEDELYGADASALLDRLRRVEAHVDAVMLVGHNPGLQDLALDLTGGGDEAAVAQLHTKFPTAALATLDLGTIDWNELGPRRASLTSLVLPRRLR